MILSDYDRWKLATPPYFDGPICEECGGNLRRVWPSGWACDECDEREIAEAYEQAFMEWAEEEAENRTALPE
jgi:ribosomal protein L37AE/L43A